MNVQRSYEGEFTLTCTADREAMPDPRRYEEERRCQCEKERRCQPEEEAGSYSREEIHDPGRIVYREACS